jgi:hypothetical protein
MFLHQVTEKHGLLDTQMGKMQQILTPTQAVGIDELSRILYFVFTHKAKFIVWVKSNPDLSAIQDFLN